VPSYSPTYPFVFPSLKAARPTVNLVPDLLLPRSKEPTECASSIHPSLSPDISASNSPRCAPPVNSNVPILGGDQQFLAVGKTQR
jgi:hypothetical protein